MAILHGWPKLESFSDKIDSFPDPIGIGSALSLILVIFAEFLCSIMIVLGVFTRVASIILLVTMAVAAFIVHAQDSLGHKELALIYFACYATILFVGSGKYSINRISFR